ncbi:unnamed protein product [Ectocarpus sp. 12 AP-2014]
MEDSTVSLSLLVTQAFLVVLHHQRALNKACKACKACSKLLLSSCIIDGVSGVKSMRRNNTIDYNCFFFVLKGPTQDPRNGQQLFPAYQASPQSPHFSSITQLAYAEAEHNSSTVTKGH